MQLVVGVLVQSFRRVTAFFYSILVNSGGRAPTTNFRGMSPSALCFLYQCSYIDIAVGNTPATPTHSHAIVYITQAILLGIYYGSR